MAINALQSVLRSATGKELQFTGDFHAYWDQLGIPPGQFAERMVAWKQLPQNAAWIAATEDTDAAEVVDGLWKNGEQGVWYDPSNLSTMYQDAAGTLPVYAPGQGQVDPPVGLLLDKRLGLVRGINRFADRNVIFDGESARISSGVYRCYSSSGAYTMVILGPVSVGRWYELTFTIDSFSVVGTGIVLEGVVSTPSFTTPGLKSCIVLTHSGYLGIKRSSGSVDCQISNVVIRELSGNHAYQTTTTSRPTLSARHNLLSGTESLATQSVAVAAASYVLNTSGPGSVTLSGAAGGTYGAGVRAINCTAGTLTVTVSGSVTQADLRPTNDGVGIPPYQRVVDALNYDTAGFPLYLRFDGVDDWMQTASIDFSGSDKILFAAAVRKESDAFVGVICELSAEKNSNAGAFALLAPGTNGLATFVWASKGTVEALATAIGMPSPISAVLVGLGDISGKISRLRVNGSIIANNAGNQGTGNYGNYALYIGRRGGSSLPLKGRIYGLLSRGGELVESFIPKVEKYLNAKARIY